MTTSPWWPESADALKTYIGHADIGLHLNLTLGAPLGPMPTLAPHATLPDIGTLIRSQRGRTLPLGEIAEEIDRQCERFVTIFGRPPDHVDGHQHVHALRSIRPLLFAALERRAWRPWLRDSADRLSRIPWRSGLKKALILSYVGDGFRAEVGRRGFACNDGFAGYSAFDPTSDYASLFESYLKRPGPRHLVMCHPGYVDDALRRLDPVVETREQELRFLTSGLAGVLERTQATLTRLREIGRAPG